MGPGLEAGFSYPSACTWSRSVKPHVSLYGHPVSPFLVADPVAPPHLKHCGKMFMAAMRTWDLANQSTLCLWPADWLRIEHMTHDSLS